MALNGSLSFPPLEWVNGTVSHVIHVQDPLTITRMFEINTADYQLVLLWK